MRWGMSEGREGSGESVGERVRVRRKSGGE